MVKEDGISAAAGQPETRELRPAAEEPAVEEPATSGHRLQTPAAPARSKALDRVIIGASAVAITFFASQILMFGYGRDQGIYAMVADAVLRGQMPYRDAWDFKPPGIFLVFAAARALFGPAQVGIRVLEVAGLFGMCAGLVKLAERFWQNRAAGFLAAALALLTHAQLDFWHTAQPESFGGMVTVFALLLAARTDEEPAPGPRRMFLAGVLFGVAGLLKPPLAGGGAVLALYLAHRTWRASAGLPPRGRLRSASIPFLWVALGGVAPIAATALWFLAKGALRDLHAVLFVFTPYYTKLGWEGSSVGGMFYWSFIEWLTTYCSAMSIGVLLALGYGAESKHRPFLALLLGIIAIHLLGVTMQGKFFPYHYGATWPLTALVAAYGFDRLRQRLETRGQLGMLAFGAVVVASCLGRSATKDTPDSFMSRCRKRITLLAGGFQDRTTQDGLMSIADVNAASNRRAAEIIRERVAPGRPVFVWGFEPVIYDLAERPSASRFLYNVPQRVTWSKADMRKTLLEDLAKTPPAAVVVEHHDVFPMVTGDTIDSADTLFDFWDFFVFLQKYELIEKAGDLDVYIEKPPSEG